MYIADSAHARCTHDTLKTLTNLPATSLALTLTQLVVLFLFFSQGVVAAPSSSAYRNTHVRRQESGQSSNSAKIWVPLAIVGILLALGVVIMFSRRNVRSRLSSWGAQAAIATGTVSMTSSGPRVLTADQLAGTNSAGSAGNNNNNSGTAARARSRNPRRTRRTPSQISTTSLPAYMKEPGDQEVVVSRGPPDMEDMEEDDEEGGGERMPAVAEHGSSDEHTHAPTYIVVPPSANDMPLLQPVDSRDSANESQQHLMARSGGMGVREDFESYSEGNSSFLNPQELLDRGEAPPYFEVVAMDSQGDEAEHDREAEHPRSDPFATPSPAPTEDDNFHPDAHDGVSRRRTGIFSIFNSRHTRVPNPGSGAPRASRETTRHTRELSGASLASGEATSDEGRPLTRTTTNHRASHSASGSVFSLGSGMFRTMSRSQTNLHQQMTSPSMISLNSISAPLTHTLVRTEFTYPKSGPTPQQLRLIASRESVARFGVPYGPDAVAYAASASRLELEPPPPGFEEVMAGSSSSPESAHIVDMQHPDVEEPASTPSAQEATHETEISGSPLVEATLAPPVSGLPVSSTDVPFSPELSADESGKPLLNDIGTTTSSEPSSSSSAPPPAPATAVVTASKADPPRKPAPLQSKTLPPVSFRPAMASPSRSASASEFGVRAPSRASSFTSFATAEETLRTPSPTASTPRVYTTDVFNMSAELLTPTLDSTPRGAAGVRLHESPSASAESVIPAAVEAH